MTRPTSAFPNLHLPHTTTPEDLARLRAWLRSIHGAALTAPAPRPFLLVTPLGLPLSDRIDRWLADNHISITQRTIVRNWPRASTALYAKTDDDERLRVALGFEALWQSISLSLTAERWDIAEIEAYHGLLADKSELRTQLGTLHFHLHIPEVTLHAPQQLVRLQAIHVPDLTAWADESRCVDSVMEMFTRD